MDLLKVFESDIEKLGGKVYKGLKDIGYDILSTFTRPEETVSWTAVPPLSKSPIKSEQALASYAEYMQKRNIQAGKQEARTLGKTFSTAKSEAQSAMKLVKPIYESKLAKELKWIPFSKQVISATSKIYPYEYAGYKTFQKAQKQIEKHAGEINFGHLLGAVMGLSVGTPLIVKTLTERTSKQTTGTSIYSSLVSFMPMMVLLFMFMFMLSMFKDMGSMF